MSAGYRYAVGSAPAPASQTRYFIVRVYDGATGATNVEAEVGVGSAASDIATRLVNQLNAGLTVLFP